MEVSRVFEADYRVRFDEADASGSLRPSGFVRYAQDLAWRHSDAAGFDRDWYEERGTVWLVRGVALRIRSGVDYGETLVATTEVTGWRRVWARRSTIFRLADGRPAAEAETDWVLLTTEGRPTRIPEEISRFFAPGSRYRPEKVDLPPTPPGTVATRVPVRGAGIDPLGHLNNAAYVDIIDEAVKARADDKAPLGDYHLEFIRPALPGMTLDVAVWRSDPDGWACRMTYDTSAEVLRARLR